MTTENYIQADISYPIEEINFYEVIATILDNKWLIIIITFLALTIGFLLTIMIAPIYQTNTTLHIQNESNSMNTLDLDVESIILNQGSKVATEIALMQSRTLLKRVIERLNLDIVIQPNYFPLLGEVYARYWKDQKSLTALFGLTEYVWGGEKIRVERFDVPSELLGKPFTLVVLEQQQFALFSPDGILLLETGIINKNNIITTEMGSINVYLSQLKARTNTKFFLQKAKVSTIVSQLQDQIEVKEQDRDTNIIEVSVKGKNPLEITQIADNLAQFYVLKGVEDRSAEAQQMITFIDERLPEIKTELERSERELNAYRRRQETVDVSLEIQNQLTSLAELEKSILSLELELTDLSRRFTDQHPFIKSVKAQLNKLLEQKNSINNHLNQLPETQFEVVSLMRDAEISREIYLLMLNNSQELKIAKAGILGNAVIIDPAEIPSNPIEPKKKNILIISLVVGLLVSMILAFLKKWLNPHVQDPDDINKKLGLNIFASIPYSDKQEQIAKSLKDSKNNEIQENNRIITYTYPKELSVEALKSLRTNLQFSFDEVKKCRIILITGAIPSVGKSFISVNLAAAFQQIEQKVLLIDGDLRRGYLNKYFLSTRSPGLSEAIVNAKTLEECIQSTAYEGLDLMPTGTLPPNPSEILSKPSFKMLLDKLSNYYQYIIIDTPPVLLATDFAIIARYTNANFAVVRQNFQTMHEIELMKHKFEASQIKLNGIIFNGLKTSSSYYSYKYRYNYSYN